MRLVTKGMILPSPYTIYRTAVHESAHAVVARRCGMVVVSISLDRAATMLDLGMTQDDLPARYSADPQTLPERLRHIFMMYMAGAEAEGELVLGDDLKAIQSWKQPWNELMYLRAVGTLRGPELLLFSDLRLQAQQEVKALLRRSAVQRDIQALARALIAHPVLTGAEVEEVLRESRQPRRATYGQVRKFAAV
jgi:hypothetical protein